MRVTRGSYKPQRLAGYIYMSLPGACGGGDEIRPRHVVIVLTHIRNALLADLKSVKGLLPVCVDFVAKVLLHWRSKIFRALDAIFV